MAEVQVTINSGALNRFLNKTVQAYLAKQAREIAAIAQQNAPTGATGELKNSISVTNVARGGVKISVSAPYAGYVHAGTGPQHQPSPRPPYYPKLRRSGLILWSESKGANPYQVAHGISKNGTPANPFLTDALEKVLGRYDFRWIKRDVLSAG